MSRTIESAISTYADHFAEKIKRLKQYELHPEDRALKKNILVSILDAMSRVISNEGASNRERFTAIVAHFGDWPEHSRVSAPHLTYLLRSLRSPAYERARAYVTAVMRKNSDGRLVQLSDDPELDEIRNVWPVSTDQKLVGELRLSSFTHLNLLYHHRNTLVHELREPGYGMEFRDDHERPFYHGMTTLAGDDLTGDRTLELVYPLGFFFYLASHALENVARYLRKHQIDPYGCYSFGSSWIGELNE